MQNPSVLVLDSGIGGLSITQEIRKLCPQLHITYLADLAAFPYGPKSGEQIVDRVVYLMEQLVPIISPQLAVVACNTASTVALPSIRQQFDIPVVGVVPAIKPAAKLTHTGVIGMLATEGTVNRSYTHNLIKEFAHHREVFLHGSAHLVLLAEEKLRSGQVDPEEVKREAWPLISKSQSMDTVVLACTHFPLLREELIAGFPQIKFWVDSGNAIARRVLDLLGEGASQITSGNKKNLFINTAATQAPYYKPLMLELLGEFEYSSLK